MKNRLTEIKEKIKELVNEAEELISENDYVSSRAKSYWIPHLLMALDNDHNYVGGSMCTMQDTIDELEEDDIDEEDYE